MLPDGAEPEEESSRDVAELSRRARTRLAHAFDRCPPFLVPSFRLWHYPAAGRHVTWVAFQCRVDTPRGTPPVLRRIAWDRDQDLSRLTEKLRRRPSLEPAMSEDEAPLDEPMLNGFVKEATTLSLPFRSLVRPYVCDRQKEFGLEGFDVEGRDGRPVVRVEWMYAYADEIKSIAEWSRKVREWFIRILP